MESKKAVSLVVDRRVRCLEVGCPDNRDRIMFRLVSVPIWMCVDSLRITRRERRITEKFKQSGSFNFFWTISDLCVLCFRRRCPIFFVLRLELEIGNDVGKWRKTRGNGKEEK